MEHLSLKEQLIEQVVNFDDDSDFCIHLRIISELQEINLIEDSEYD